MPSQPASEVTWLLELNPFSGADLYACRMADVIAAVSGAALAATRAATAQGG